MKYLIEVTIQLPRVFKLLNVISVKRICKVFLVLVIFLLPVQALDAEELNRSLDFFDSELISHSLVPADRAFDETGPTLWQTAGMGSTQKPPVDQSGADSSSPWDPFYGTGNSPENSETTMTGEEAVSSSTVSVSSRKYASDQIIVRFKSQNSDGSLISNEKITMVHKKVGAKVKRDFRAQGLPGLQVVQLANGTDVQSAIKEYESNPDVLYAEPDYIISISPDQAGPVVQDGSLLQISTTSNDTLFTGLWGLHNTGQNILGITGTPGADISATAAWDLSTGSDQVIVAVVDTGVFYSHDDLFANIWTNPGETAGNGKDDDHNGYIDDIHGWNFITNTPDPLDDNGHGTHVSGTIGAMGNNGIGVTGVNWQVRIMALKAFNAGGSGDTSDAVSAILYAKANGASVISNSWNGPTYIQSLKDAIDVSQAVVVCAAGNSDQSPNLNNDDYPQYPASYTSANIVSVAATDQTDQLASFSHYGPVSVDLAAPGVNVLSTNQSGGYDFKSGTSMATPHVSGVAALVKSVNPSLTNIQIKNIILSTVDVKDSLAGKVSTGGRLNAYHAVLSSAPPIANFTATPRNGSLPLTVTFTDLSQNLPDIWMWSFGDGDSTNATVQNPVHTYMTPGVYTVSLNVSNLGGTDFMTKVGYINVTDVTGGKIEAVGVYRPSTHAFYLRNSNYPATPPTVINWGASTDLPVTGDWDGDNKTEVGVYRPSTHTFYLRPSNYPANPATVINWGASTDLPVTGDWDGDNKTEVGVYRPSTHSFYLRNSGYPTTPPTIINWGASVDLPIIGLWS